MYCSVGFLQSDELLSEAKVNEPVQSRDYSKKESDCVKVSSKWTKMFGNNKIANVLIKNILTKYVNYLSKSSSS